MNRATATLVGIAIVSATVLVAILIVTSHGATAAETPAAIAPPSAGSAGSGSAKLAGSAGYLTNFDEADAAKLFAGSPPAKARCTADPGHPDACHGMQLVANCTDGTEIYAPPNNYVRARKETGGYERRITDPVPIVVPMSFDWCGGK